ncbi:hypothetical protein AAG570_005644 [Ranatra chinensis]|uniref:Uncharacterized protein n=1 Tax=Ranatra chinensis TaxID=642074 RepID=A0ABD0YGE8_9HEMI
MDGDHSETPVERAFARWESENRIQKLLYTEYSELEDIVLVESPFAQTTKDGVGIRQIQMGLTSTKLILASDVAATAPFNRPVDTTLELLMVCPVQCVRISTDDSGSRYTLKAHFCHDKVLYFELASPLKRDVSPHISFTLSIFTTVKIP